MFTYLSYTIDNTSPIYGGKKGFISTQQNSIEKGDTANTSKWEFPNHIGTHVDFPYHFYENGQTVEDFSEDFWIIKEDKIQILDISLKEDDLLIKPKHITNSNLNKDAEMLILKTGYSKYRKKEKYWKFNPGIDIDTAEWIKKTFKKIKILGIDSISISSWQHRDIGRIVHKKMLNPKNPTLLIEDMDLSRIDKDTNFKKIYIAPLIVKKTDGSPCTIIAEVKD